MPPPPPILFKGQVNWTRISQDHFSQTSPAQYRSSGISLIKGPLLKPQAALKSYFQALYLVFCSSAATPESGKWRHTWQPSHHAGTENSLSEIWPVKNITNRERFDLKLLRCCKKLATKNDSLLTLTVQCWWWWLIFYSGYSMASSS